MNSFRGTKTAKSLNGEQDARSPTLSHHSTEATGRPIREQKVSVVIPARNEEKCLPYVLKRLPDWLYEVILVDGMSTDQTNEVARLHLPSIRIVSQPGKGKGDALREGFRQCTGDVIVALDADGSMDPAEIAALVAPLRTDFDYAKGSRMMRGGGSVDLTLFRRMGNWMLGTLTNILHGSHYTDLCYGYFAFRREVLPVLNLKSDGFEIETEINIKARKARLRIIEVPSHESDRLYGESNLKPLRDGLRVLWTIIRERLRPVEDGLWEDASVPVDGD